MQMATKLSFRILVLFSILFMVLSCAPKKNGKGNEGTVYYDIKYLSNDLKSVPMNFMPKSMVLRFKEKYTSTGIDGFMGLFSITYIADNKKNINTTLLKFLDNRFYYTGEKNEYPAGFDDMKGREIEFFPEDTLTIAGLKCEKAVISFPGTDRPSFDVYFTNEVDIYSPNIANPYKEIDGLLLAFNVKLSQLEMRFTANKVIFEPVKDDFNKIPEDFKPVGKSQMIQVINSLLK